MDQTFGLFALILRLLLIKLVALPQALSSLRMGTGATGVSREGVAWVLSECRVKSYTTTNIRTLYGRIRVPFMHQDSRPW